MVLMDELLFLLYRIEIDSFLSLFQSGIFAKTWNLLEEQFRLFSNKYKMNNFYRSHMKHNFIRLKLQSRLKSKQLAMMKMEQHVPCTWGLSWMLFWYVT